MKKKKIQRKIKSIELKEIERELRKVLNEECGNNRRAGLQDCLKGKLVNTTTREIEGLLIEVAREKNVSQYAVAIGLWDLLEREDLKLQCGGVKTNEGIRKQAGKINPTRYSRTSNETTDDGNQKNDVKTAAEEHNHAVRVDRDRILQSWAFRRLEAVTQIVTPDHSGHLMHSRLTHSVKVGEVGRRIAEKILREVNEKENNKKATSSAWAPPSVQLTSTRHAWLEATREECNKLIESGGGLHPNVVEAAGLAHDMGHPPFGHAGEKVLDRLAREVGLKEGFEGNAQTLRVLTRMEFRFAHGPGMDLTNATLAAVIKYPWTRGPHKDSPKWNKFNAYASDKESLVKARKAVNIGENEEVQTLEASIMDIADDITYALHDLEDFYTAGLFRRNQVAAILNDYSNVHPPKPTDSQKATDASLVAATAPTSNEYQELEKKAKKLKEDYERDYGEAFVDDNFNAAVKKVHALVKYSMLRHFDGSRAGYTMVRTAFASRVSSYIRDVYIREDKGRAVARLSSEHWYEIQVLKWLTRQFVISRSELALTQLGQERLLEETFHTLLSWCARESITGLPITLRELIGLEFHELIDTHKDPKVKEFKEYKFKEYKFKESKFDMSNADKKVKSALKSALYKARARATVDYIASLTDAQLVSLANALSGAGAPSSLYFV